MSKIMTIDSVVFPSGSSKIGPLSFVFFPGLTELPSKSHAIFDFLSYGLSCLSSGSFDYCGVQITPQNTAKQNFVVFDVDIPGITRFSSYFLFQGSVVEAIQFKNCVSDDLRELIQNNSFYFLDFSSKLFSVFSFLRERGLSFTLFDMGSKSNEKNRLAIKDALRNFDSFFILLSSDSTVLERQMPSPLGLFLGILFCSSIFSTGLPFCSFYESSNVFLLVLFICLVFFSFFGDVFLFYFAQKKSHQLSKSSSFKSIQYAESAITFSGLLLGRVIFIFIGFYQPVFSSEELGGKALALCCIFGLILTLLPLLMNRRQAKK